MRVAVIAGEASGDLLGAGLLRALRGRVSELESEGIGGPQMLAEGFRSLYPMERLSVMGLVEAAGRYAELIPVRRRLARRFLDAPPDVLVGVDAPDFNLALEHRTRAAGIPTVHYVSPSVWAWRRYRIRKIARSVDLMLTLFPFEARFYERHDVPVVCVGHPLADMIPETVDTAEARDRLGLDRDGEVVALLPGSRMSEVKRLAAPLLETAAWMSGRRKGLRFVVPLVNALTRAAFVAERRERAPGLDVHVTDGSRSRDAMAAANVVMLASGTASLEALLLKRPMIITYRTNPLTGMLMRRMLKVPFVGLPNLLAGREVAPEFLQEDAVPARMGAALLGYLERPELWEETRQEFSRIHASLRRGASDRAADAILGLVEG